MVMRFPQLFPYRREKCGRKVSHVVIKCEHNTHAAISALMGVALGAIMTDLCNLNIDFYLPDFIEVDHIPLEDIL